MVVRPPLPVERAAEASRLYESGLSLDGVADRISVTQETMRVAIIHAGVSLRPPAGAN